MKESEKLEGKNFSIVLGGPFFQLLNKVHLTGKALELVKRRTLIISMIAWLPLLLFSMLKGEAWGDSLSLTFLKDFDVHIRFLVAMPLLIVAELLVNERMLMVVRQFEERKLIPEHAMEQFRNAIASAYRLRNSMVAEPLIVVIIYVIGYQLVWKQSGAVEASTWYFDSAAGDGSLSLAGNWFRFLSLPIWQFLFLRWYYRIFIWSRFLFQVSRIKLNLVASHPDQVGGLGFMANSIHAFVPLALAHGAMLAGMLSNHIFYEGAVLLDFKIEIGIVIVLVLLLAILPLFFFSSQLAELKRTGTLEYGRLASQYVREFDDSYVKGGPVANAVMGADIQSLADLANSYDVVKGMQIVPITRAHIIMLAISTAVPVLPLVLTMMPMNELIKILAGVLL